MADLEKANVERIEIAQAKKARRFLRGERLRQELAVHAADVRSGRFRTISHAKSEPLPWDGKVNSQIIPLNG